ncbi:hypothetical protein KSP39_PZI001802 [Platanthera zijinensis]|uniref:WD repeat-containing protein 76 n=1 Tax=Platanthera zijinensis TaxID=2320716 RepID=A0AAP0BX65_9ASPA
MAPKNTLTEYESRRLENIRRNEEIVAALMLRSKASELSASLKRSSSKKFKYSKPPSPVVIRRSLRTRGLPPSHSDSPVNVGEAFIGESSTSSGRPLFDVIMSASALRGVDGNESDSNLTGTNNFDPMSSMTLKPENVARVLPDRIFSVQFLPSAYRTVVAVGDKSGKIGFWDLDFVDGDGEREGNGIYVFAPHSAPVSGISVHPSSMTKIFTCSYDGLLQKLDVDKETFSVIYSSEDSIFSICQRSCDTDSLYIGELGVLKIWDERAGKASNEWSLHEYRINTIDFNPENLNIMATSSRDGTACIWDLRSMNKVQPKVLGVVNHKRAVNSAYFSPNGSYLATTSFDDRIGILNLSDLTDISIINHNNQTGRWLSSFRAIWGWDDSFLFLGNMGKSVDIISTKDKTIRSLESPEMTSIPCRFAAHRHRIGTLAGATAGGKVFLFTSC